MSSKQTGNEKLQRMLDELRKPFHPSQVSWKPGAVKGDRALAMAYADLRAYMNRLDEVCGPDWSVEYEPWGEDRVICKLTICGVTRSSTGESNKESERSEIGGTVAESQAMKRAAAMFGLGRYLYNLPTGWADYDAGGKKFTDKAKAKLTGILVNHYRRATEGEENAPQATQRAATPDATATQPDASQQAATPATEGDDYRAVADKLQGDCAKFAEWCKNTHANSNGPASDAQYKYLVGVINAITGSEGSHHQVLGVLVGREVDSSNPPGRDLCSKLLDWLPAEKVDKETGEKLPNPTHKPEYAQCIKNIWRVASGQLDLFDAA